MSQKAVYTNIISLETTGINYINHNIRKKNLPTKAKFLYQ